MVRPGRTLFGAVLASAGCLSPESATTLVPGDPFHMATPPPVRAGYAPASVEAAGRVEAAGQRLLAANPQVRLRPVFRTIGAPQPEVFHVRTEEIDVTEGLVGQCRSESELAAVLALELGRMAAEREVASWAGGRGADRQPPPETRVGNDSGGAAGAPDLTRLAELGRHEKENGPPHATPPPPPDPQGLARGYLRQAGYAEKDLETVLPLVQAAGVRPAFERQFRAPAPQSP
jgi:hypothetical protein